MQRSLKYEVITTRLAMESAQQMEGANSQLTKIQAEVVKTAEELSSVVMLWVETRGYKNTVGHAVCAASGEGE